jgi:hypothetical protein
MGDVSDVDPEPPLAVIGGLEIDGVVEVLGIVGVDGNGVVVAAVFASVEVGGGDLVTEGAGFLEDGFGEVEGELVMAEDREHVDAFGVGRAEDFDNLAFGVGVAGLPFTEFDDDFIADAGGASDVAGGGHVDVVGDAWVIGDDVEELAALLQGADDAGAAAFEDADDGAGVVVAVGAAEAAGFDVAADEDAVFVQGGAGGVCGDGDFFEGGVVGLEVAVALAGDLDAAGDEIGLERSDIAIGLGAGDAAGLFQGVEGAEEGALVLGGDAESARQFGGLEGDVVPLGQEVQDILFHDSNGVEKGLVQEIKRRPNGGVSQWAGPSGGQCSVPASMGVGNGQAGNGQAWLSRLRMG